MEAAATRPPPAIPLTNPITPGRPTRSLSSTPGWFDQPLSSSPQSGNLTMIEVVPPTPPSRARPVNLANDPTSIPASPMSPTSPMSRGFRTPKTPAQPLGTPRTPAMGMRTPGVGRRNLPGGVANRANRLSAAFHAGTPPPAFKTLPAAGDGRRPISHAYVKDGRRTSIATDRDSMVNDHRRSGLSARQSIVTLPDASPATHPMSNIPIPGTVQITTIPLSMPVREADLTRAILNAPLRPILKHTESGTGTGTGTASEDTYLAERTWRTSESSHSSASDTSMRRVDPLTLLERRRRRDFTIGSHHPAHPPPNTPATPSLQSVETDPDEVPEVTWNEMYIQFREGMHKFWKRWGDMPWVAEPCVAKLVIPQAPNLDVTTGEVVGWYRRRPTLGQILGEEPMEEEKGVVNGYYVGDSAPETGATAIGDGYDGKDGRYEADDGRFDDLQERFGNEMDHRADDSVSITETIVPPPIPRKEAKWFPKRPEPMHDVNGEYGRERWEEAVVMRSSRYPSGVSRASGSHEF